jgi:hypothetical protein
MLGETLWGKSVRVASPDSSNHQSTIKNKEPGVRTGAVATHNEAMIRALKDSSAPDLWASKKG